MGYLLDTDIYIYLTQGNQNIRHKIHEAGDENLFMSAISVAELYFGIFKSKQQNQNLKVIQSHLEKIQILNFNRHVAKIFGRLKASLVDQGKKIADMDLAIAAIAIYHQHTLVTHNIKHFKNIPELLIEDWA